MNKLIPFRCHYTDLRILLNFVRVDTVDNNQFQLLQRLVFHDLTEKTLLIHSGKCLYCSSESRCTFVTSSGGKYFY
jgi:hypothetical protein